MRQFLGLHRLGSVMAVAMCASLVMAAQNAPDAPAAPKPAQPPATQPDQSKLVHVLMSTDRGDIVLELNREKAPISVANFLNYVDKGHYSGTVFHRIMKDFMIQGGGFTADGAQKPTDKPIKLESGNGLHNERGTVAMARTGVPDSATSQFFINVVDNSATLDATGPNTGYAVFGKVVAGMSVVDAIRNMPVTRDPRGELSKPTELVSIQKAQRITSEQAKQRIDAEPPKTDQP